MVVVSIALGHTYHTILSTSKGIQMNVATTARRFTARRAILPLAALLAAAAAALTVGSGANFTSISSNAANAYTQRKASWHT